MSIFDAKLLLRLPPEPFQAQQHSIYSGRADAFFSLVAISHARDRFWALAVNGGSETDKRIE